MANSLCHYFIFVCLLCWLYLYLSKNSVMNLVTTFIITPTITQDVLQIHWIFVTYPFLFSVLNLFLILCPQLQYTES